MGFSDEQLASGMQVLMQLFIYVQQALLEGETLVLEGLDAGRVVCALTGGKQHEP